MKIYVAGHRGLIGSAIVRMLIADGVNPEDIITKELIFFLIPSITTLFTISAGTTITARSIGSSTSNKDE